MKLHAIMGTLCFAACAFKVSEEELPALDDGAYSEESDTEATEAALRDASGAAPTARSRHARLTADGRLVYEEGPRGDRIPDFSHAGYGSGGVALPRVPARVILSPRASGDDGDRINAAIDRVGRLPVDEATGFRGAVLLRAGTYRVAGKIRLDRSGVVLRGEGNGQRGTIIRATRRTGGESTKPELIEVGGQGSWREVDGTRRRITNTYVPVGATRFQIRDARGYRVGDRIIVHRPSTQAWIDRIGMDRCDGRGGTRYDTSDIDGRTCLGGPTADSDVTPWRPGERDLSFDRVVTNVRGDTITIDAPLTSSLDDEFGGGWVYQYRYPGRVSHVGIENLRGHSNFDRRRRCSDEYERDYPCDESHAWDMITLRAVENAWVRDVTARHFAHSAVAIGRGAKWVTVQDTRFVDPVSRIDGQRRYAFNINGGQLVLVQRCEARNGRHDFVLASDVPGPNVFRNCHGVDAYADIGPHQRWSVGVLFDNVVGREINIRNRGNKGSGHGWAGANQVVWNSRARRMHLASPPTARVWGIGCRFESRAGDAIWDSPGELVAPRSLYLAQLRDRLGGRAVANVTN